MKHDIIRLAVATSLDCRDDRHPSCDGGACACPCHTEEERAAA